jgi:peptidoglycan/LPS O-acetylase OafA/YrhL
MATAKGLTRTLATWSAASIVGGVAVWAAGRSPQARAFGRQTLAWGAVDAAIAAFGASRPDPDPRRLRRILLINCVADVGYLALAATAWRKGRTGDGAAIAVQGAFLLALDSHYAYHLEVPAPR